MSSEDIIFSVKGTANKDAGWKTNTESGPQGESGTIQKGEGLTFARKPEIAGLIGARLSDGRRVFVDSRDINFE